MQFMMVVTRWTAHEGSSWTPKQEVKSKEIRSYYIISDNAGGEIQKRQVPFLLTGVIHETTTFTLVRGQHRLYNICGIKAKKL